MEFIMKQNISDGLKLILKAFKGNIEDKLYLQWLSEHIYMDKENFISFEEYLNMSLNATNKTISHLSAEEIIKKTEKIKQQDQLERRVI